MSRKPRKPQNDKPDEVHNYAKFWQVDLHVHTPASQDADPDHYDNADPEDIVHAAIAAGLDAIAITDHNTAEWCDQVAEAASGTDLIVLPGVEISTSEGHLLAIFEEGTPARHVEDLLAKVGIPTPSHGDLETASDQGFIETAKAVSAAGGLAIAAHIDRDKGLLKLSVAARRKRALQCDDIRAFEVVDTDQMEVAQNKAGKKREPTFVRGSDSTIAGSRDHRIEGIGSRRTWIKAGRPDFKGLEHALDDPALRLATVEPTAIDYPFVESIRINGGFLDGVELELSPDLTCLLGGTGTGKSLLLELIRFALDQQTDATRFPTIRDEVDLRLEGALGLDSSVELVIALPDDRLVVRRAFAGADSPPPDVADSPEIDVPEVLPIRAFSQSEVIEYARTPGARMLLIDGNLDLSEETAQESALTAKLSTNAARVAKLRREIAGAKDDLEELPKTSERVKELADLFKADIVKSQEAWSAERVAIESLEALLPDVDDLVITSETDYSGSASLADNQVLFDQAQTAIDDLEAAISKANKDVKAAHKKASAGLKAVVKEWKTRHKAASGALNKEIQNLDTEGRGLAALKVTLEKVQTKESKLKAKQKKLEDQQTPRLSKLIEKRESLLDDLVQVRRAIRDKREERIGVLNELMSGVVRLKLDLEADSDVFATNLREIARGSNLKTTTLLKIADNAHPLKLVRSFLDNDAEAVANATGATETQVQRLFDHVNESEQVKEMLRLQHQELSDVLVVEYRKSPSESSYERIERLAHGQKCTAILVVSLADGAEPLIIDQPEDALHAPWIEEHLVGRLRDLRGNRQFIFASRSPGLVVSADAELLVTLTADDESGQVEASGSLERYDLNQLALYHLEGGEQAFTRRTLKLQQSLGKHI